MDQDNFVFSTQPKRNFSYRIYPLLRSTVITSVQFSGTMAIVPASKHFRINMVFLILTTLHILLVLDGTPVSAFAPPATRCVAQVSIKTRFITKDNSIQWRMSSFAMSAAASSDDEVARQLERARAVLEASRAKMESRERAAAQGITRDNNKDGKRDAMQTDVPFFATQNGNNGKVNGKRDLVIKNQNQEGLFTTDGDLMAKLSETEEWESRSLFEVFKDEANRPEKDRFADRDVAASIYGLQKVLQTEDFQKIFDKRNRFIGEQ
jgi:hypothetical protein